MHVENRLKALGIELPDGPAAVGAYAPCLRTGNLVMTSGQLPWCEGRMAYVGRLGAELDESQGYEAARRCAINAIAQLKAEVGDLDRIARIIRLEGDVHAAPGFRGHPQVLNGASDLFNQVFEERGRHTRTAVGISEMPLDAAVQISIWAELADERMTAGAKLHGRIAHFTLATRDVSATAEFFEAVLGWRPIRRPSNIERPAAWLAITDDQELHLVETPDFAPSACEREYGRHFAFVFPREELPAIKSRLRQRGVDVIAPQRATPFERFFFHDPNGYCFEVVQADHQPEP